MNDREIKTISDRLRSGVVSPAGVILARIASECGFSLDPKFKGPLPLSMKEAIKAHMAHAYGVPRSVFDNAPKAGTPKTRLDALEVSKFEKNAQAVTSQVVFVKPTPGSSIRISGQPYIVPAGGYLAIDQSSLSPEDVDRFLVVENLTSFLHLDKLAFPLPDHVQGAHVLYRGQPQIARVDTAIDLLKRLRRPVTAFYDLDPAGIRMAMSTPFVDHFLMPDDVFIEAKMMERRGRQDLFEKQSHLRVVPAFDPVFERALSIVSKYGQGLTQEEFMVSLR